MAGKSYKAIQQETTPLEAVQNFYGDIETLAADVRELVDNASGTATENTGRIQTMSETADLLEGLEMPEAPELPEALTGMKIKVFVSVPKSKKSQPSRAVLCENACSYGRAGTEAVLEWCDAEDNRLEEAASRDAAQRYEFHELLREWADEVNAHIDEAEGAEFPGMYNK
jgi:hypothetical protein